LAAESIKKEINLHQLSEDIDCSEYDPAQFPGLIYRPSVEGTLNIFSSGKYSITGIDNEEAIRTEMVR